jgi:hypothetical protein
MSFDLKAADFAAKVESFGLVKGRKKGPPGCFPSKAAGRGLGFVLKGWRAWSRVVASRPLAPVGG